MTTLLYIILPWLLLAQVGNVNTATVTTANITTASIGTNAPAGGPDVYYYSGTGKGDSDYTDGATTPAFDPHLNGYGAPITVAQAGTCTKIAAKVQTDNGLSRTWKIGLYNASFELIANGTADTASLTPVWIEVAGLSTNVTAATYYVMCWGEASDCEYAYDTDSDGRDDGTDYGDAPPASVTLNTTTGYEFGVKMYVD